MDFVATTDKTMEATVLESCSYCREMNTINVTFNSGKNEKGFMILILSTTSTTFKSDVSFGENFLSF